MLSVARIEAYLQDLEQARQISQARYQIGGCKRCPRPPEEGKVDSYSFPRTLVTFPGEEEDVALPPAIHDTFSRPGRIKLRRAA